jgi:hypothetical protein|tara:strand:+ start:161 stop:394 length:234 start_codon:yes stop_codon:yes gene_type:complete
MQTLLRILDKVKQLGDEYHCFHQEIPPTGAGTRRYMLMKIIEPIKNPKEDFGKQEWIGKPLPALEFEATIDKLLNDK